MTNTTRRMFLAAGVSAAATIVPRHVLGGPGQTAPSDRVNVALVGAGGRGLKNARELMRLDDVRITHVADPAQHWDLSRFYYGGVAGRSPACQEIETHYETMQPGFKVSQHSDFRQMLDKHADDIDAVLCATPDHLHATVSLPAMRAGKGVYCEKPLTHNIAEARLVADVAKQTGVATQMGNQGHSTDTIRETVERVRSGAIGRVTTVHAWVPATRWNKGMLSPPTNPQPKPNGLDWQLWCGPRQVPPFHSAYAPVSWRDFWQFGLGAMGDFGCHDLDSSVWALQLGLPDVIELSPAGQTDPAMIPYGEYGVYQFSNARQPWADDQELASQVTIHWYSGGLQPPRPDELPVGESLPRRGVLFIGTSGIMVCGGAGGTPVVYRDRTLVDTAKPTPSIKRSAGHHRDWIDAVKGGPPASSHFEYASKLTEITLLGVLALRMGEPVRWEHQEMQATGLSKAEPIIRGDYRDGWKLVG